MSNIPEGPIAEGFLRIRGRFLAVLDEKYPEFRTLHAQMKTGTDTCRTLEEFRFGTHKILGVASTLGFDNLGRLAAIAEQDIFDYSLDGDTNIAKSPVVKSLGDFLDEMKSVLENQQAPN